MQVIEVATPGGPEALCLVEAATPEPRARQLLVRVEAAGVNFIDVYQRSGLYKRPTPFRMGLEGAGIVERVGTAVTDVAPGARVAWASSQGSYATHAIVEARDAVPVPASVSSQAAAAAMLQGMTAHYLSFDTFPLAPGHSCLVYAAAGGVGLLLCQMAKAKGARVFGVTSTEEKAELARAAGAEQVFRSGATDLVKRVREANGGVGVDVVYDSVGRDTFETSLGCLRPRGMLVLFGQSSGPVPPLDPQVLAARGSLFLTRPTLGHYTATRAELLERAGAVLGAIGAGQLDVRIGAAFPLAAAADAHRALESRATTGKVILLPSEAA